MWRGNWAQIRWLMSNGNAPFPDRNLCKAESTRFWSAILHLQLYHLYQIVVVPSHWIRLKVYLASCASSNEITHDHSGLLFLIKSFTIIPFKFYNIICISRALPSYTPSLSFEFCIFGLCNSPKLSYLAVIPFLYPHMAFFVPISIKHHSAFLLKPSLILCTTSFNTICSRCSLAY